MANWCLTELSVVCKDYDEAKNLYSLIDYCLTQPQAKEDKFGRGWLGFLVEEGLKENWKDVECYGYVCKDTLKLDYNKVEFMVESAWTPESTLTVINKIVEKFTTNGEIIFNAEEEGQSIFVTNDINLIGKYTGHWIGEEKPILWEQSEIYEWI